MVEKQSSFNVLKENIKNKEWWKSEFKEFGLSNLLIILAITLIFCSFYFEYAPKIQNPCDWCIVQVNTELVQESKTCTEWIDDYYIHDNGMFSELNITNISNEYRINK